MACLRNMHVVVSESVLF